MKLNLSYLNAYLVFILLKLIFNFTLLEILLKFDYNFYDFYLGLLYIEMILFLFEVNDLVLFNDTSVFALIKTKVKQFIKIKSKSIKQTKQSNCSSIDYKIFHLLLPIQNKACFSVWKIIFTQESKMMKT